MTDEPDIIVPGPSAQEKRALDLSVSALEKSQREQDLLAPILYEQAGLIPVLNTRDPQTGQLMDENLKEGEIIRFEQSVDPLDEKKKELEEVFLDRSLAAASGDLPVDPQVIRDFDKSERVLRESLRKQLGEGYESSSPGIEALSEFESTKNATLAGLRRDELTLAEGLSLGRSGANTAESANELQTIAQILGRGSGTISQGNQIASLGLQNRQLETNANIARSQITGGNIGSLFQGVGSLAGSAASAYITASLLKS